MKDRESGEDLYMYRCLNQGMISSSFAFLIPETGVEAVGYCDSFSSGAVAVSASIAAGVALISALY